MATKPPVKKQDQTPARNNRREKLTSDELKKVVNSARDSFVVVTKKDKSNLVWRREADYAIKAALRDDRLLVSPPETLIHAVSNIAYVGLSLNPVLQHCVILPKWNKKLGGYEATLMVMYRGLMHLATEAGVTGIKIENIFKLDKFDYGSSSERGDWYDYQMARSAEQNTDENPYEGSLVAATMPSSKLKVEFIPRTDIFKMRDESESYKDGEGNIIPWSPWVKWATEMYKKAALKRAQKRWETIMEDSSKWERFQRAVHVDNEAEGVIRPKPTDIEGSTAPEVTLSDAQIGTIMKKIEARTEDAAKRQRYIDRICAAYGKKALSEIPARFNDEIVEKLPAPTPAKDA